MTFLTAVGEVIVSCAQVVMRSSCSEFDHHAFEGSRSVVELILHDCFFRFIDGIDAASQASKNN